MKRILAKSLDEIRKERAEWQAQYDANEAQREKEHQEYRIAEEQEFAPIERYLDENLRKFDLLKFDINVNNGIFDGIEVRIRCNEDEKFNEDNGLSWDYTASLSRGQLKKETSSWSGMSATTEGGVQRMKQTAGALEFLLSVDWENLLNRTLPDYETYHTTPRMENRSREFDKAEREAAVSECIGNPDKWLVYEWARYGKIPLKYARIIKETPKRYNIEYLPAYMTVDDRFDVNNPGKFAYGISTDKDKFLDSVNAKGTPVILDTDQLANYTQEAQRRD